jgi:membrane associated rhomboid family serine protease
MLALPEINFKRTPATLIIMAVAVALEVVCTIDDLQGGGRRLAYCNDYLGILPLIWMGELWRPFTSTLMHGDLLHAGFNVYWLLIFGAALENHLGSYRTLGLIVLLGYVSMLPEYVIGSYHREQPIMIVGLSGIVYGLFGMLWIGRRWRPEFDAVCTPQTAQILLIWFFLCIVLTYTGHMMVANIAHGAGFIFGVLYGQAAFSPERRRRWIILAVASSLLVLSTLIACPGHFGYEHVKRSGRLWWNRPARLAAITSCRATASASWPAARGCRFGRCARPGRSEP